MLIAALSTSPVNAASFKLSASFKLGSLDSAGTITGLGGTTWNLQLNGDGNAITSCTNLGGNTAPGQNFPHVTGTATTTLAADSNTRHNGKSPYSVVTGDNYNISSSDAGCPNSNWTAKVVFVKWTHATILVDDNLDFLSPEATFNFNCVTTYTPGSNSTPSTFDDGTIVCTAQ